MSKDFKFPLLIITSIIISVIIYYNSYAMETIIPPKIEDNNFSISGKVKKVIDGDSIIINKYEIRLHDIDAPEYKQQCSDKEGKPYPCGINSLRFLTKLIYKKEVNCKVIARDYYKRYLATCYKNDLNINNELVKTGNAVIYSNDSKYYRTEQIAKKAKIGIWQGKFLIPKQYRKLHRR